jgi:uncharacterized protein YbbC (DUF1343 family)
MNRIRSYIKFFLILLIFTTLYAGKITPAADRPDLYLPQLKGKHIALVVNHSSLIGKSHLVDYMLKHNIKVQKIFAPEHGFRGKADAGAHVKNSRDRKTGLPIVSLYGKHKKPTKARSDSDLQSLEAEIIRKKKQALDSQRKYTPSYEIGAQALRRDLSLQN